MAAVGGAEASWVSNPFSPRRFKQPQLWRIAAMVRKRAAAAGGCRCGMLLRAALWPGSHNMAAHIEALQAMGRRQVGVLLLALQLGLGGGVRHRRRVSKKTRGAAAGRGRLACAAAGCRCSAADTRWRAQRPRSRARSSPTRALPPRLLLSVRLLLAARASQLRNRWRRSVRSARRTILPPDRPNRPLPAPHTPHLAVVCATGIQHYAALPLGAGLLRHGAASNP